MSLLIDGYNLLHVTGIAGRGGGPGGFHQTREALLRFLAASISDDQRVQTTVVFDANDAPPGLPKEVTFQAMTICYARDFPDADAMIEQLIARHHAPRSLLVVSSDHRIQRAARRRKARSIDSDRWYSDLWQRRVEDRHHRQLRVPEKPVGQLSAKEIDYWVEQFSSNEELEEEDKSDQSSQNPASVDDPFPPGYAEDLLDDVQDPDRRDSH